MSQTSSELRTKIFVSYHHDNDRDFFKYFCRLFADRYEIIEDTSIERTTGSTDGEYIVQNLRSKFISCADQTIVLCGILTPWRKFVDWEIKATLDESRGLIGINLPTNPAVANDLSIVPDRLFDNIRSGYASLLQWQRVMQEPELLAEEIRKSQTRPAELIRNSRPLRQKGG